MTESRRLAAIMCADVAGYSRLMGVDEEGTLRALQAHRRELIDPQIAAHGGRIVKTTGDGLLIEFASVVQAVRGALAIQTGMAERTASQPADRRIAFRIGINLGDILAQDGDIFGDGVNIAARLQELAEPGGICISARVHEDVRDRLQAQFADAGEQVLKNIARPVRAWRWNLGSAAAPRPAHAPPAGPSIAVLPFASMSSDAEQQHFADGLAEDIITALSRMRWLLVASRQSSFAYRSNDRDVRQIGRELGVRYVLEGSVRRAGSHVRISIQLVDAATGTQVWAERFDDDAEDPFVLQDLVTAQVVAALEPTVKRAEASRVQDRPADSLGAQELYLRAIACRMDAPGAATAAQLLQRAIELDARDPRAKAYLAFTQMMRWSQFWAPDGIDTDQTIRLAEEALAEAWDDPSTLRLAALALTYLAPGRRDRAIAALDRALALAPNSILVLVNWAMARTEAGEWQSAVEHVERAARLDPFGPDRIWLSVGLANAHLAGNNFDTALEHARAVMRDMPQYVYGYFVAGVSLRCLGRASEAEAVVSAMRAAHPGCTVGRLRTVLAGRSGAQLDRDLQCLRAAGLPE